MHLSREGHGSLLVSFDWITIQWPKNSTSTIFLQQDLQDNLNLFVLRYFLSVLMDGLTFTQTKGAPFGQGALNVLPMHELTGAIAACGSCTEGESHLGSSFLRTQRPGDRPQRAQHPLPPTREVVWVLAVLDNVACDNCQNKSPPHGVMSWEMRNFNHSFL